MENNPYIIRPLVARAISEVVDPELYVSITDLGLLYNIFVEDGLVRVEMTLTTIGCPLFSILENDIKERVLRIDGIENVEIKLVFDPPWEMRMIAPEAQAELGID